MFYCGSTDHLISNCTEKKSKEGKSKPAKPNDEENLFTHTTALLLSPKKTEINSYKVRVPLMPEVKSEEVQELDNGLKIVKGYVNGVEACVLRDTGCTTVCISKQFAENNHIESKAERIIKLANGSECLCHEVEVDISSPYLSGMVVALTMECPFADVIVGETAFLKASEKDKQTDKGESPESKEVINTDEECIQVGASLDNIKSDIVVGGVETRAMKKSSEQQEKQELIVERSFLKERQTHPDQAGIAYKLYNSEGRDDLKQEQRDDKTLDKVRELANVSVDDKEETHFFMKNDVLYRQYVMSNGEIVNQIVVPKKYRYQIMHTAHDRPFGGHLGNKKTRERILNHFYWPGIFPDVAKFCKSCENCQKCIPKGRVPKAPLIPIQPMDEPFKRVAIDIVGPLNRTKRGHKYILVICDYATKYPEAIPLKSIESESVATALIDTFSRVGFPTELLSDQGTNFMSALMEQLCKLLQIRKMNTTPYHPQANGLVENFNGTLKKMLKCYAKDEPEEWDKHIPFVLFAYRESPHESTGYSSFELLYGHKVRGPLQLIKESWEEPFTEESQESLVSLIIETRDRLKKMHEVASEIEARQKKKQKGYFDKKSKVRELELDQKVLVLLPSTSNKLLAEWKGPYIVIERVSPVDYKVQINRKTEKIFHINMLKAFHERGKDDTGRKEAIQCLDIICSIEDSLAGDDDDDDIEIMCTPSGIGKKHSKMSIYRLNSKQNRNSR